MQHRIRKSLISTSVAASLSATLFSASLRADSDNPISTGATVVLGSTLLIGQMTGNAFSSSTDSTKGSSAGTTRATGASEAEKRALAATAIEDAAAFYATGELSGILPAAVRRIRELVPEAANASDAEIVDAIAAAADSLFGES